MTKNKNEKSKKKKEKAGNKNAMAKAEIVQSGKVKNRYKYREDIATGEYNEAGKPKYKTIRANTAKELYAKIESYKSENKSRNSASSGLTVNEWFDTFKEVEFKSIRTSTRNMILSIWSANISPFIGSKKINDVTPLDCKNILASAESKGLSHSTLKKIKWILNSIFVAANENHIIKENPVPNLHIKGTKAKKRRELTPEERKEILEASKEDDFGLYVLLLFFFGLRRGECSALTGEDFHDDYLDINKQLCYPDNHIGVISAPKTSAGVRRVPIPDIAREYIDFDNIPDGYLFAGEDGKPWTYHVHQRKWKNFISKALGENTDITEHCLRHNFITMCVENGMSVQATSKIVGHDDSSVTREVYTHYSSRMKDENTEKFRNMKVFSDGNCTSV